MFYIADYFALGMVIILFIFFFDNKTKIKYMRVSSKVFGATLVLTALNAVTDLLAGKLMEMSGVPLWLNMLVNTLYFITNLVTTSGIALYLFVKILEHTHRRHCMRNAKIALGVIFGVYLAAVICNFWTGILFYFDDNGVYCRGPLNGLGYYMILPQMLFVLICYFRNKETANKLMRRALVNVFPVVPLCIVIQRMFPEIMMNSIFLAYADAVLFMTFMSQRQGVHALTELNDRHRFLDEVNHFISKKEQFQIFLINLKNFGAINQKFGHLFGDEYLYQFAFALEKNLKGSLCFHMNGTVFAVVTQYIQQNVAEKQSGILLGFLDGGVKFGNYSIETEYIVSHYVSDGKERSARDIYEIMEYSIAKAFGMKQRYVYCTQNVKAEVEHRRYLRERLQKIDREHGYEVWYQPINCIETGKFCSMEALIRLREASGELISPAEFIPLAEETGQINSITWFVLEEVCKSLSTHPELKGISVSINVPMAQLVESGFVPRFMGIVDQAGIEHRQICIEFTERTILEKFHQTQNVMKELTDEGFRFFLDDFGSGYSNFNCLMQLPFQVIKFDAGLSGPRGSEKDYTTVRALTKIFHDMDLVVVAEGAETENEVLSLTEIGVDRVQGYVFARPMPEEDILKFYTEKENEI